MAYWVQYIRLLRHATNAVFLVEPDLRIAWANPPALARFALKDPPPLRITELLPEFPTSGLSGDEVALSTSAGLVHIETAGRGWAVFVDPLPDRMSCTPVLEAIPVPVFFKNRAGIYVGCNQSFAEFLNLPRAAILGRSVFEVAPSDLAQTYFEMDEELFRQGPGGSQSYEADVQNARGAARRVLFHKANFGDGHGHVLGLVGVIFDITDLRTAENDRAVAHQRLHEAIGAIDDAFALFDPDDRLVVCNDKYIDFFPCLGSREEAIGMTFAEIAARVHAAGLVDFEGADECGWQAWRMETHRDPAPAPFVQKLKDGRWIRINERRTADGGVVGVRSDITSMFRREQELEQARRRAEFLAFHDPLTGLPNRQLLRDRLETIVTRNRRSPTTVAVLFLDLDGFKGVNDSCGHLCGDRVLKTVAQLLLASTRESDTVARLGGDEFVVVAEVGSGGRGEARQIAGRILEASRDDAITGGGLAGVTLSIGVALFPDDAETVDAVLSLADRALYRAKSSGKNTFAMHNG